MNEYQQNLDEQMKKKKLILRIQGVCNLTEQNLTAEKRQLEYNVKHKKYKSIFQKNKDVDRLKKVSARHKHNTEIVVDLAKDCFFFCENTMGRINQINDNIKCIYNSIKLCIEKINDDMALQVLNILKNEMTKRRTTKNDFLKQFIFDEYESILTEYYNVRTPRLLEFINENELSYNESSIRFGRYQPIINPKSESGYYLSDIKHYIETVEDIPLNKSLIILKEFVRAYDLFILDESFMYEDELKNIIEQLGADDNGN